MDATQVQLLLTELYTAHSTYMVKLSNKEKLGIADTKFKFKGFILSSLMEIMADYLSPANTTESNFFTTVEIEDIVQHFNNIANTNIYNTSILNE